MRKQHPWRNDPICRIDVTAFLSVMIALLAAIMAPSLSHLDLPANTVDLPHASNLVELRDARREDAIHIYVQRDGRLWFGTLWISRDQLPGKIREAIQQGSRPIVFISADRHARYADVSSTLARIQSAGITRIAFVANPRLKLVIE